MKLINTSELAHALAKGVNEKLSKLPYFEPLSSFIFEHIIRKNLTINKRIEGEVPYGISKLPEAMRGNIIAPLYEFSDKEVYVINKLLKQDVAVFVHMFLKNYEEIMAKNPRVAPKTTGVNPPNN